MDWFASVRRFYRLAGAPADLSGIRIHCDGNADRLCQASGALAVTVGSDIHFRAGCWAPRTPAGLWLLAHEVAHVVQQRRGPVLAIPAGNGSLVGPCYGADERAADAAADSVLAGRPFDFGSPCRAVSNAAGVAAPVVQRYMAWEHVLLGNMGPSAIGMLQPGARNNSGEPAAQLIQQCALLDELGRNPVDADLDRLQARYPGVQLVRLPDSDLIVTAGELNVLPDYFSGPEAIITAPLAFLLPLVQAVRAQGYRHIHRMTGRQRISRREWSTLRYPNARMLADIREAIEIESLGRRCRLPESERYLSVLARNACHFAPFSWYRWQSFHLRARQMIEQATEAADPQRQRLRRAAQVFAGYADHFLQDSFAAGHLMNKTLIMQWYLDWLTGSGQHLRDRDLLTEVTCTRQPDLHGPELYCPRPQGDRQRMCPQGIADRPAVTDPQTAAEAPTLDERVRLSGVRGCSGPERQRAYLCYLAMLGNSVAQLPASVVHDYLNKRSLVVASAADGPAYRIWGDRTMLGGGAGAVAAAHSAQASRHAIADLLRTGETGITSRQIFESMPAYAEVRGALVPLPEWHDLELRPLCWQDLFGRTSTRLRKRLLSVVAPGLGLPSADYAGLPSSLGRPA
jgi:Domain of unknown function (DUF4157)